MAGICEGWGRILSNEKKSNCSMICREMQALVCCHLICLGDLVNYVDLRGLVAPQVIFLGPGHGPMGGGTVAPARNRFSSCARTSWMLRVLWLHTAMMGGDKCQ